MAVREYFRDKEYEIPKPKEGYCDKCGWVKKLCKCKIKEEKK